MTDEFFWVNNHRTSDAGKFVLDSRVYDKKPVDNSLLVMSFLINFCRCFLSLNFHLPSASIARLKKIVIQSLAAHKVPPLARVVKCPVVK